MMLAVSATKTLNPFHRIYVTDMSTERITGVGGINNQATAIDDCNCLLNQSPLRIVRMNFEELRHNDIRKVGPR